MNNVSLPKFERINFFLFGFAILAIVCNFLFSMQNSFPPKVVGNIDTAIAFNEEVIDKNSSPTPIQISSSDKNVGGDYSHTVKSGDTFLKILTDMGIENSESYAIANGVDKVYGTKNLSVGQKIRVVVSGNGSSKIKRAEDVRKISVHIDRKVIDGVYDVKKGVYNLSTAKQVITSKSKLAQGLVKDSLYRSAVKAGASPTTVANYIKLLGNEVNFKKDMKPDSEFRILFDYKEDSYGKKMGDGDILYAYLSLGNKKIEIYKHKDKNGKATYFYGNGKSLKKSLLARPIKTTKISSGFGGRMHPIHHYRKMHTGVDYAAKTGTPIYAAGNGIIQFVGFNSGYGRHISIKHNSQYSTLYAHMSKFHSGVKKGARITQGEIIGYVGNSGSATGPHLHYEVRQNGRPINPIKASPNIASPLEGKMLVAFKSQKQQIDKVMHKESKMVLAKNN